MKFKTLGVVVAILVLLSHVATQTDPGDPNPCACTMGNPCCWYVDARLGTKNGTGTAYEPFSTIQAAVERASSGDSIFMAGGDYVLTKSVVIAEMAELHLGVWRKVAPPLSSGVPEISYFSTKEDSEIGFSSTLPTSRNDFSDDSLPRLIDWGIQIQATSGMIYNITISDMIIESSSALRIIGTVSDVKISRVSFLMLGPASEDVIKLDRVKLGGDGTNPVNTTHGVIFEDCVFNTRDSVLIGQNFFSWRQLVSSPITPASPNNRVIFERTTFLGGDRGELTLHFESVSAVSFLGCALARSSISIIDTSDFVFGGSRFEGSGLTFTGNVSRLEIFSSHFANFGPPTSPGMQTLPTAQRPTCITFDPHFATNVLYEQINIHHNNFTNFTGTSNDPFMGYAAILFLPTPTQAYTTFFTQTSISHNDFSLLAPYNNNPSSKWISNEHVTGDSNQNSAGKSNQESDSNQEEFEEISNKLSAKISEQTTNSKLSQSFKNNSLFSSLMSSFSSLFSIISRRSGLNMRSSQSSSLSSSKSSSTFIHFKVMRNGPIAISCESAEDLDVKLNYYGNPQGPSSCCNPESPTNAPRVSPHLTWYPWCANRNCSETKTVVYDNCIGCADQSPLIPAKKDNDGTLILILITTTMAVIIVIVGLTGLYCFTRPKSNEQYSLVPVDGWRSRLLASVPDVQALFDQVGVPLINYNSISLNPIPIGVGSFGRVYDGLLYNSEHIELHRELRTLMDNETLRPIDSHYRSYSSQLLSDDGSTPINSPSARNGFDDGFSSVEPSPGFSSPISRSYSTSSMKDQDGNSGDHGLEETDDSQQFDTSNKDSSQQYDMFASPSLIDTIASKSSKKEGSKLKKTSKQSNESLTTPTKKPGFFSSMKPKKKKKEEPRPIAVKELNSNITDSYEDIREFLEEIKIMASIDHPNLLKLRGVAIDPLTENILLVMDLMDLGSLDDVIFKRKIPLTFARKLAISTEIGYALHYLHSKEPAICHRDLKPGNVLVSKKWNVKVCDFGSSRVLDRKTATLTLKGTPIYLAPESINSSKFSEKSDVYSYGVTLVELFGGARAFDDVDGSAANLMYRIATEGLRPTIPSDLPASLKSLLRRCMATNPDDRPNFTDILEKLAEVRAASADSSTASSLALSLTNSLTSTAALASSSDSKSEN